MISKKVIEKIQNQKRELKTVKFGYSEKARKFEKNLPQKI